MKICERDASCRKSGPSTAFSEAVTARTGASRMQAWLSVLSPEREVVQTNAYTGNVSILEAPIAPDLSGRI